MKPILASLRFEALEFLRHPGYLISTFLFPGLFFVVFAAPNIEDSESALLYATSFSAFGILGVVFFQYTLSVIDQKASGWESLRRTLPISSAHRVFVKIALFAFFGIVTGLSVFVLAYLTTPLEISLGRLGLLLICGLLLSIPFLFLGGCIAYRLNPLSALPTMNMIYLLLSFSGGLWLPPDALPKWLAPISLWLPTRQYGEVLWAIGQNQAPPMIPLLYLLAMTFIGWLLLRKAIQNFEVTNYR
jgi:ABC-2 type transport system permease protein